jgi:hypothetical protein
MQEGSHTLVVALFRVESFASRLPFSRFSFFALGSVTFVIFRRPEIPVRRFQHTSQPMPVCEFWGFRC